MTATKIQPGDDLHLTSLMAPHSLNFVTGPDRAALLAFGRDVFAAARDSKCLAQIEEPAQPVAEICSASHDDAEFGERAIKPLCDISGFEYGTPLYAGAAPAAAAPRGEYPHEQMDAMALDRYKVVPSNASMLWSHAVVAGDGAQQLYVGREVECQNMARKFAGAFLDGAFAFHSMAAAPTAQAAPALEAPAAPAGDEEAAFTKWFQGEQGKPYQGMWEFARAAWMARAATAAAPQAPAAPSIPQWIDDPHDIEQGQMLNPAWVQAQAAPAAPAVDAPIVWPKARDVGRIGDMSPSAHLRIGLDSDNDVYASIWGERGGATIEFCTPGQGGGKSSRTRMALLAVMVAMEADNAADPGRDWWAERNHAAQAAAKGA